MHNITLTCKLINKVIANLDSSRASGPDCNPEVVLKKCELELWYIQDELFICVWKKDILQIVWRSRLWFLYLWILGKGLQPKATALSALFLWLVKWLRWLQIIGLLVTSRNAIFFPDFVYIFRSSQSTADLLTVLSEIIARTVNMSGATQAVAFHMLKGSGRVWHVGLLYKCKKEGLLGWVFGLTSMFLTNTKLWVALYGKSL